MYTLGILLIFLVSSSTTILLASLGLRLMFGRYEKKDLDRTTVLILRGPISVSTLCMAILFAKFALACILKFKT